MGRCWSRRTRLGFLLFLFSAQTRKWGTELVWYWSIDEKDPVLIVFLDWNFNRYKKRWKQGRLGRSLCEGSGGCVVWPLPTGWCIREMCGSLKPGSHFSLIPDFAFMRAPDRWLFSFKKAGVLRLGGTSNIATHIPQRKPIPIPCFLTLSYLWFVFLLETGSQGIHGGNCSEWSG